MDKFDWRLRMKVLLFSFKIVGLWPKRHELYTFNLYTLYATISFTLGVFHVIAQIIQVFLVPMDLEVLAGTLFIASQAMAALKSIGFIKQIKMIRELVHKLNDDIFQPRTTEQRVEVTVTLDFWWKIYVGYQIALNSTVFLWLSFPLLDKSYKDSRLPFTAWYPYDYRISPFYEITYLYQSYCLIFLNICNANLDMFSVSLMIYVGAQCDILCDNLKSLTVGDEKGASKKFHLELVDLIKQHKEILSFVTDFNVFVDKILFAQFLTSILSLALSFFQLTLIVPFSSEFFSIISLIVSVTSQIFLYCWYGNEIDVKSKNIPYAAFKSQWIGISTETFSTLLIFSLRTQRQITIKTFNLFPLSLATFMTIMRSAWSYFAVLRQVNVPPQQ